MGILEFFGLGNNTPATTPESEEPATVEMPDTGVEETTPDNEEVAEEVEPEEVAAEDTAPAPEEVEPEEVEPPNELQLALHAALIKLDGRLRDSAALQYDEAHLTDSAALEGAITALIHESPHLATTAVSGDIGQGNRATAAPFNLIDALRATQ